MEDFARLAHDVKCGVEALETAFWGLDDWPDAVGEAMSRLCHAINVVVAAADEACKWATICNADFDPAIPKPKG
jgi:hypothetical protein